MEQTIERGIVTDDKLIGRRLVLKGQLGTVSSPRILLRNITETENRFRRDHLWIKTEEKDIQSLVHADGFLHFTGVLVEYKSKSISFQIKQRWTSVFGRKKLCKYKIDNIKIVKPQIIPDKSNLPNKPFEHKPLEHMEQALKLFNLMYPSASLNSKNDAWFIKNNGETIYCSEKNSKLGVRELDYIGQIYGATNANEKFIAESVLQRSQPLSKDFDNEKIAKIQKICETTLPPDRFKFFFSDDARLVILRSKLCGNLECLGLGCPVRRCGARFIRF